MGRSPKAEVWARVGLHSFFSNYANQLPYLNRVQAHDLSFKPVIFFEKDVVTLSIMHVTLVLLIFSWVLWTSSLLALAMMSNQEGDGLPSKRISKCSGCHHSAADHDFGPVGPYCSGPAKLLPCNTDVSGARPRTTTSKTEDKVGIDVRRLIVICARCVRCISYAQGNA